VGGGDPRGYDDTRFGLTPSTSLSARTPPWRRCPTVGTSTSWRPPPRDRTTPWAPSGPPASTTPTTSSSTAPRAGSPAEQILRSLGARVTAVCCSEHVDLVGRARRRPGGSTGRPPPSRPTPTAMTSSSTPSASAHSSSAGSCSGPAGSGPRLTSARSRRTRRWCWRPASPAGDGCCSPSRGFDQETV
jgi:hypothetical protein